MSSNDARLRVGIVGRRGVAFAGGFQALPQANLVALCDIDADRLAEDADKHDIPLRFTRLADMLEHVDAVVIATPMQLHAPQAILALQAGKHVLSEVTACVSLDECWRLVDAVKASGKTYMLSENYCYMRDTVLIRELARKGMFGDVYYGEGEYLHDVKYLHHLPDGSPAWRYYWQVGTNGSTYPTHSLGPVMQWFTAVHPDERIDSVVCIGTGRRTDPEHPHDDTSILLCRLRSGRLIRVRVDMMSNRPHHMTYYALQGTTGVYEGVRAGGRGHVWFGENPAPGHTPDAHRKWQPLSDYDEHLPEHWKNPPPEALRAGHGGGDYFVARDFVESCLSGSPPPIDVYTGLEWTAAGLCSRLSLENGGVPIKVPDFRDPAQRPVLLDAPPAIP